jgi:hypothetical protein
MNHVNQQLKTQWGSYSDRQDSFDDSEDISRFIAMVKESDPLKTYIKNFIESGDYHWVPHPDGMYGVDLALVEKGADKRIVNFDLERWSVWKNDWPHFYRNIHFLGRKEKFLNKGVPFLMCYLNYNRDRVLVVDEETIKKYPTVDTHFKKKNVIDTLKKIPLTLGNIFGKYSETESTMFRTGD